ncbi:MAG: hypothetical protein LBT00_11330 [Spirochaetaceae bacterium]|nr:hypothetical protein [Spirochaetaceae bacterium]
MENERSVTHTPVCQCKPALRHCERSEAIQYARNDDFHDAILHYPFARSALPLFVFVLFMV